MNNNLQLILALNNLTQVTYCDLPELEFIMNSTKRDHHQVFLPVTICVLYKYKQSIWFYTSLTNKIIILIYFFFTKSYKRKSIYFPGSLKITINRLRFPAKRCVS